MFERIQEEIGKDSPLFKYASHVEENLTKAYGVRRIADLSHRINRNRLARALRRAGVFGPANSMERFLNVFGRRAPLGRHV